MDINLTKRKEQEHCMRYQRSSVKGHHYMVSDTPCLATEYCHAEHVSTFGVDILDTFCVMGYIKVFARQRRQSSDDNSSTLSSNQTSLNKEGKIILVIFT